MAGFISRHLSFYVATLNYNLQPLDELTGVGVEPLLNFQPSVSFRPTVCGLKKWPNTKNVITQ